LSKTAGRWAELADDGRYRYKGLVSAVVRFGVVAVVKLAQCH